MISYCSFYSQRDVHTAVIYIVILMSMSKFIEPVDWCIKMSLQKPSVSQSADQSLIK